jgi:hypothetical protein
MCPSQREANTRDVIPGMIVAFDGAKRKALCNMLKCAPPAARNPLSAPTDRLTLDGMAAMLQQGEFRLSRKGAGGLGCS